MSEEVIDKMAQLYKINKKIVLMLLFTSANLGIAAETTNSYLLCETSGEQTIYQEKLAPIRENFKQQVLVSITKVDKKVIFMSIEPLNCNHPLFRCNKISNLESRNIIYKQDVVEFDSHLYFRNEFKKDISIWTQVAKLNKFVLKLEVNTSRFYEESKGSGLDVKYEGECKLAQPKI